MCLTEIGQSNSLIFTTGGGSGGRHLAPPHVSWAMSYSWPVRCTMKTSTMRNPTDTPPVQHWVAATWKGGNYHG